MLTMILSDHDLSQVQILTIKVSQLISDRKSFLLHFLKQSNTQTSNFTHLKLYFTAITVTSKMKKFTQSLFRNFQKLMNFKHLFSNKFSKSIHELLNFPDFLKKV